uniref:Zinc finger CCCH-type with G patch domain-containing protein n=2 Tax=Parascaris univalens TaxID=6257 RepID=A0A915A6L6_PARUN
MNEEEELLGYKAQLDAVDAELKICTDLERRSALMEMHADISELISLLTEGRDDEVDVSREAGPSSERSMGEVQDAGGENSIPEADLIGMNCRAPYSKIVDRAVVYHDAIILDFVDTSVPLEQLKVRVLYSYPLEEAMRPCQYFLDDRCTYGEGCRYSHGEEVSFHDLLSYQPPNFESMKEESLVLVQGDNKLWSSGRVVAIDGQNIAVNLLVSGKEVASVREKVIPLNEDTPLIEERAETMTAGSASSLEGSWTELKGEKCGRVSVGDIGDWERHTRGIGMKLLLKMGYRMGEGLGRKSDGIVHAIQPIMFPKKKSLDVCMQSKHKKVVDERKDRVKKEIAKRLCVGEANKDIFDILNHTLNAHAKDSDTMSAHDEKKHLKAASSKKLGVDALNLDRQMKELKGKERKLREGITRNQRDRATVEKLKRSLAECQKDIEKLVARQDRLSNEVEGRRTTKGLF